MSTPLPAGVTVEDLAMRHVDALHAVLGDPGTWQHAPASCFTDRAQTATLVERHVAARRELGLGDWAVLLDGEVVGLAGCSILRVDGTEVAWNLGYRLTPATWGRGIASAVAAAAVRLAAARDDLPVVARMLEHNPASLAVARHAGLEVVHRQPCEEGVRVLCADRALEPDRVAAILSLG